MQVIWKDYDYEESIDVLARVYKNQNPRRRTLEDLGAGELMGKLLPPDPEELYDPKEQICVEVLFKPHVGLEHRRATAEFPRGAARFIVETLNEVGRGLSVQVSNELNDNINHLHNCRANFSNSLEWGALKAAD